MDWKERFLKLYTDGDVVDYGRAARAEKPEFAGKTLSLPFCETSWICGGRLK